MNIDVSINDAVTIQEGRADARSAHPRVLAEVDHFEIRKPLGAGGFGTVYLARDTTSDIDVALKVVGKDRKTAFCSFGWDDEATPRGAEGSKGLENELRENFKLIHGLTHPNIAVSYPLHLVRDVKRLGDGVSISRGDILSVMAYAPGVTLDKWRMMFEGGRVPVRLAGDIVMQIASALDYAHANGVIHRDVKPSNIMVDTREGCKPVVRLLDFGLAATTDGGRGMCGTPQYMSPEQWGGEHQDRRTDQYALAVLACELLTGHVPLESVFKCDDREVMRIAVMNREPEYPKGLSGKRRQAIERAMAKSPDKRFANCVEFADALFPRPRPWLLALVCFMVVFVLSVIGVCSFLLLKDRSARTAQSPTISEVVGQKPVSEPIATPERPTAPIQHLRTEYEPKTNSASVTTPRLQPNPGQEPNLVQEVKKVVVQAPVPEPPPKPTLSAEVQTKLRQANQSFSTLKRRFRDPDEYKDIELIRSQIADALKAGECKQVETLCHQYSEKIAEKQKSLSERVGRLVDGAKKSLVESNWRAVAKSCEDVLALEPENSEARSLIQRTSKNSLFQAARGFAEKKRWQECLDTVNVILELDPNHRQAQLLKARAENGLETKDSPRVATPQNTLQGSRDANGLELLNQRNADDDWRHKKSKFFD